MADTAYVIGYQNKIKNKTCTVYKPHSLRDWITESGNGCLYLIGRLYYLALVRGEGSEQDVNR